jgi:hypothetical protein
MHDVDAGMIFNTTEKVNIIKDCLLIRLSHAFFSYSPIPTVIIINAFVK